MGTVRFRLWGFAGVAALALAVKLRYAAGPFRLYSDSIAYVNIARHWASGDGFVSSLRLNYFDPGPVTHLALVDWPPLYPLVVGVLTRLGVSASGLQAANAVIAAFCAGLVFLIAEELFDRKTALLSGLVAALALNVFKSAMLVMSDALGLALALCAVLAAVRAKGRPFAWFAAGALAGAAYLTRFPNMVLMVAFVGYAILRPGERRNSLACIAGFALTAGPILAWKWALYGSPVAGVQSIHYATTSFKESSWTWFEPGKQPSISHTRLPEIIALIWRNTRYQAESLFRTTIGLYWLSAAIPFALVAHRRSILAAERGLVLLVALLQFAVYASTWSLPAAQAMRFMLVPYCLLLPFACAGVVWLIERRSMIVKGAAVALSAVTICAYCLDYPRTARRAAQYEPLERSVVQWAKRALPDGTIVASNNPWLVAHQTGLPATAMPHNLDESNIGRYVRRYHIGAFLVIKSDLESPTTRTLLESPQRFKILDLGPVWVATPKR